MTVIQALVSPLISSYILPSFSTTSVKPSTSPKSTTIPVHVMIQICLKIPSSLLHMELTHTQVHKYDFSNRYGYPLPMDVVQI